MLTSDEHLLTAMSWAEEQGLGLNVFLDVVSRLLATHLSPSGGSGGVVWYLSTYCCVGTRRYVGIIGS